MGNSENDITENDEDDTVGVNIYLSLRENYINNFFI